MFLYSYSKRGVMMSKKGSLNLSINAIVVLILAITMLGLGLGFMKTMFGKVSEDFLNASVRINADICLYFPSHRGTVL